MLVSCPKELSGPAVDLCFLMSGKFMYEFPYSGNVSCLLVNDHYLLAYTNITGA